VQGVLAALDRSAESLAGLGDVDHPARYQYCCMSNVRSRAASADRSARCLENNM
jgi:hypothetical protein